jgi:hypothetical protein
VSEPNYYTLPLAQLRILASGLRHAGVHEIITDSEGKVIGEKTHHYLGCKRCAIEDIIHERSLIEAHSLPL